MNSCINSLSHSSYGVSSGIEPSLHVINSLGLPNKSASRCSSMSSAAVGYPSSGKYQTVGGSASKTGVLASGFLQYDTVYSPKTYRPASMYNIHALPGKRDFSAINPVPYGGSHGCSYPGSDSAAKSSVRYGAWTGGDPDENNNFLREKGRHPQCGEKGRDTEQDHINSKDRIRLLAQPKRLPCEYQEDRDVYWSNKRFRPNCGNHTHFETTARLDELALPKTVKEEIILHRPSLCDMHYSMLHPYGMESEPRVVDWDRLATPKRRYPPNFRPIQHVRKSALKAAPTKRLCKLSAPKPVIDAAKFYLWLWGKKPDDKIILTKVERLFIAKCHLAGMRVMVRCDLDPCTGGDIESKLAAVLPTIKYILSKGAKSVIIVSNRNPSTCVGRNNLGDMSLRPLAQRFQELLNTPVLFLDDCVGYQARALCEDPEPGNVFLLENLAFHPEEFGRGVNEKGDEFVCTKEQVEEFRNEFFNLADTYVVDTFRELVSMTNTTIGYPKQEKAYGFKVKSQLDNYNLFVSNPRQPMVAIVGGTFKDTALIVKNLMGVASDIVIGGETALVFLKALKRTDLGTARITPKMEKKALALHSRAKDTKTGLLLPSDLVVRKVGTEEYFTVLTRDDVDDDFDIVDIGPFTRKCYIRVIEDAETLLWWGEMGTISDGTVAISAAFSRAAERGARTYVADDNKKAAINPANQTGRKTQVTEDSVATTMLLRGILPKGLAVLNPPRKKIKKREPPAPPVSRKPIKYDIPGMQISSGEKIMCINDINIEGKNVLIRADFHVPMQGNKILNNYRIRMVIPTIKYALKWRARTVVILGHISYPDGKREESLTMKPICDELASLLGQTVIFVPETVGKQAETVIHNSHPGTVIMLENVRFHMEETGSGIPNTTAIIEERRDYSISMVVTDIQERKRTIDILITFPIPQGGLMWKTTRTEATPQAIAAFCEKITSLGDVFVNDAFPCLNLDHSSVMSYYLPTRVCGFLVKNELKYMARICNYPQRRLLVILGGCSFKEKLPILRDLLREADDIILVGALGVSFLKVYLNMAIASSLYDPAYEKDVKAIIELSEYYTCTLYYPVDLVIASNKMGDNAKLISITEPIHDGQMVIDIGELSSRMFCRIIKRAKMVFWVGTAGIAETEIGSKGTKKIMDCIIEVTKDPEKHMISIIGGRSTCEFIDRFENSHENFTHLTTGSVSAFKLLTDRYLTAVYTLMPKQNRRPIRVMGIDQLEVADKRVLIRADLGIPLREGKVVDSFPVTELAATIKYLQKKNARSIVLIGHKGYPEGKVNNELSLRPMKECLDELLEQDVYFAEDGVSDAAEAASKIQGKVVLVENIRFHPAEEGITDGPGGCRVKVSYDVLEEFRSKLTALGDVFMNESLDSIHLTHSSVVGIGDIKKVGGPTLKKNLQKFEEIKKTVERPLLAILGGDQPMEDIPALYHILDLVDEVIICGNIAFTFLKAETGAKLGKSPVNVTALKFVPRIMKKAKINNIPVHLPTDYVADEDPYQKPPETKVEKTEEEENPEEVVQEEKETVFTVSHGIPDDLLALDIGPETIANFVNAISEAKTIIMNGVITKYYTFERYQTGSRAIFDAIQKTGANGVQAIALGTKISACLNKLEALECFTVHSNGVRAFFDILRGRSLPGVRILQEAPAKPLKKLSIQQMDLSNMRVLIRLDLFVPTVEGVVLDTDKLEEAAPTITYALDKGAKCVVLLGHRGDPNGYKNTYLSMKPLVVDLSQILERPVTLIDRPCSRKAKSILADPAPGSVFLMENLKFYPAEYGTDAEPAESRSKRKDLDDASNPLLKEEGVPPESPHTAEPVEEDEVPTSTESTVSVSDGEGGTNIDSLMYQLMTPKTVAEFTADLAACGDVFVNDDVTDIAENLTSLLGFGLAQRGCGLQLATYLSDMDDPEMYNLPGVASLSPAA